MHGLSPVRGEFRIDALRIILTEPVKIFLRLVGSVQLSIILGKVIEGLISIGRPWVCLQEVFEAQDRGVVAARLAVKLPYVKFPGSELFREFLDMCFRVFRIRARGIAVLQKSEALHCFDRDRLIPVEGGRLLLEAFGKTVQGVRGVLVVRITVDVVLISVCRHLVLFFFEVRVALFQLGDDGDRIERKVFPDLCKIGDGIIVLLLVELGHSFDVKTPGIIDRLDHFLRA